MAAQILRDRKASAWEQQKIKTTFYKFPTDLSSCNFGNDGFFLFTQKTLGREYLIVGDTPREITRWIANRAATQGFWNGMYKTMADKLGHDVFWEAGFQSKVQNKKFKMPTWAQSRRDRNLTSYVCPHCGKERKESDPYYQEAGVKYCSIQHQQGAKAKAALRPNAKSAPLIRKGTIIADDIDQYLDDMDEPFLPALESDGAANVPNNIYIRPQLMVVGAADQAIEGLNPLADAVKDLGQAAASFAPGGTASFSGELAADTWGIVTDIYDLLISEKIAGLEKPNLRPALVVSYTDVHPESVNFGSGENNSGKVTFAEIQQSQHYKTVIKKLDGLWGAAQAKSKSA